MQTGNEVSIEDLAQWVSVRAYGDRRYVVGVAGPPAAGKSTLAANLAAAITERANINAQIAPMDGFHRTSAELRAVGAEHRKGEPDTFDVAGFLARLEMLRETPLGERVDWPIYSRAIDDPVPDAISFTDHTIAIVEGNYLLLDQPGWSDVRGYLDEAWFLSADNAVLVERLIERHRLGGKDPAQVEVKVTDSDLPNADLVAPTQQHADLVLREAGCKYVVCRIR
ncbi:nucleoside/nucleotide kinase family protein [Nocardia salmonicida]|uniref:nucleoside/nucleotide kinase family protein n=1 Tax=Nocardia salmonicida TaxID=53431 RepID=UPI0033E836A9